MRVNKLNTGRQEKQKWKKDEDETHKALQNVWEVQAGTVKFSGLKEKGKANEWQPLWVRKSSRPYGISVGEAPAY